MSRWNHVAIEVDGVIFHSTGWKGVHVTTTEALQADYKVETVDIDGLQETAVTTFLKSQLGKGYDWGAVFAMPFRADWHDPKKWFCSELVAATLEAGGREFRIKGHRVTPRDLWIAL